MKKIFVHIDIETGATVPQAVIPAVALYAHDENYQEVGSMTIAIDPNQPDRIKDSDTMEFWRQQEARDFVWGGTVPLQSALNQIVEFIDALPKLPREFVANPPTFDQVILEDAFYQYCINYPWKHWEWLDLRTLRKHYGIKKRDIPFVGIEHHPMDDLKHQVKLFQKCNGAK